MTARPNRSTSRLRTALVTVTLGALAITAVASGPQQAGRDLRSTTTAVDFIAVSRDGHPVTDLKAEEVTLRVGSKNRAIKTLQFIKVSESMVGAVSAPAAPAAEPVTPAYVTNISTTADSPRSIVIMVDDESIPIGQEQKLHAALNNFVRDLPATDQVALVTVPHGGIKVGLTTDRERLRKEIANISPISPLNAPACQTLTMLSTLETTIGQLTRTSEQPVAVALLSSTLAGQSSVERSQVPTGVGRGGDPVQGGLSVQGGACAIRADDFVRVGQAVAAARAQLYIIHPDFSQAPASDGIANLQGQTGAPLFHLQSNTEPGLSRMARETSGYYIATFDTDPDDRPGVAQPTSIRTSRPGTDVRGRPFAVVGRASPATSAAAAPVPTAITAYDMVRSGRAYRDLPLRGTATAFRNDDGTLNVIALFEPIDPSVKVVSASAAIIDEAGQGKDIWNGEADNMTTWPTAIGLKVEPGKHRIRIAAIDANGRMGLIDDTIVAELRPAGGTMTISGVMLGVTEGSSSVIQPRLQFSKEDSATAYVELYGAGDVAGAIFEVGRAANDKAFLTVRGTFAALNVDGKFGITAKIPLGALAPGEYVVRAIVGTVGQPAGRVIRTLKKIG